jgi:flavin reductase (DIM6/NTAB) family NADH-FMN oxidoreductase RutF
MTEQKEPSARARSRGRPRSGRAKASGLVKALHINGSAGSAEAFVTSDNPTPDLRSRFKASLSLVASTVALIAAEAEGRRGGLTATAACSFSVDPPMMLVCINRRSHTHRLIRQSGSFSVNYLATEHAPLAELFARQFADPDAKFDRGSWERGSIGAPILRQALATVECTVHRQLDEGSHSVFIGKVVEVSGGPEHAPLLYARHRFARIDAK